MMKWYLCEWKASSKGRAMQKASWDQVIVKRDETEFKIQIRTPFEFGSLQRRQFGPLSRMN